MEQLFAMSQDNLQFLLNLQQNMSNTFVKICDLNTQAIKSNINQFNEASKNFANGKTPQDQTEAVSKMFAPIQQQAINYNKQVFDTLNESRQDLQSHFEDMQKDCEKYTANMIDNFSKNAPLGSEPFTSGLKSAIAATAKVCDGLSKATQQAVQTATNNFKTQAEQIIQETQKATQMAQSAANQATQVIQSATQSVAQQASNKKQPQPA
jgi:phasin family protein